MFKRMTLPLTCAFALLASAAHAAWVPTGRTMIKPMPTVVTQSGQPTKFIARIFYEVKHSAKPRIKEWKPLPNVVIEFNAKVKTWQFLGTDKTDTYGRATITAVIDGIPGKKYTYKAAFLGRRLQGVWLKPSSKSGVLYIQ
jgi:hypothetical protein